MRKQFGGHEEKSSEPPEIHGKGRRSSGPPDTRSVASRARLPRSFPQAEAGAPLWRAGFGPKPGGGRGGGEEGPEEGGKVDDLLDPPKAQLIGPASTEDGGAACAARRLGPRLPLVRRGLSTFARAATASGARRRPPRARDLVRRDCPQSGAGGAIVGALGEQDNLGSAARISAAARRRR